MAGIEIEHVTYRGGAPAVTGLMAGDVEVCIADISTANAALQSDRVRPVAMTTLTRVRQYPDIPTANEAGVPGYDVSTWVGAFAPAGTPKDVVEKIEVGIKDAIREPDVRAKLEQIGMEMRTGTAEEMRDVLAKDIAKWGTLVREKNIKIAQ
jgi:tripartite-type tricarboxylate transporter receptor subunit TctC